MKRIMDRINIALAQTHIEWENKSENYLKADNFIKNAANHNAEIIFFPEMSFTGFSMNTQLTKEKNNETISFMSGLASKYQIGVGFGWVLDCKARSENHYTVVNKSGEVISDYAKIHPFTYSGEDKKFKGGTKISYFVLNGISFSSFICYDLRFPDIFQAASKKADVIVVSANWPALRSEHWKTLLRARAIENQAYIIGVNCVGSIGGTEYSGDSGIIDPNGDILELCSSREEIIYHELTNDTRNFRDAFPVKADRRETLYRTFLEGQQDREG